MRPPAGYIEIDRRFGRLQGSERPEELAAASYVGGSLADSLTLGWAELLKKPLVVVLGEPGSGKSWEFRWRCATLQQKGESAFLIELERLVSGTFEALLDPDDRARFQKWRRGGQTAWFFLDSVDESKIRRSADFYAALDKVLAAIGGAMDRTRVLISSRISEWRPEIDRQEVVGRFGASLSRNPRGRKKTTGKPSSSRSSRLIVTVFGHSRKDAGSRIPTSSSPHSTIIRPGNLSAGRSTSLTWRHSG
jgi:hypothetical protein